MHEAINSHWAAKARTILAAGAVMALCTGCQTTSDPSKGGLLSGLSGLYGGKYEERQAKMKEELQRAEAEQAAAQAAARQLVQELADKDKDVQVLRQRLGKLDSQVSDLQKRVSTLQTGNKQLSDKQKAAATRLAALQKQTVEAKAQVNDAFDPEVRKTQEARQAELEKVYAELIRTFPAK